MKLLTVVFIGFISSFSTMTFSNELLVGKKVSHSWTENTFPKEWPTPTFETYICDNRTLIWNNTTDKNNLSFGVEAYTAVELAPKVLQVSWKESPETTNYGIIWTLDFNDMTINGVLVNIDNTRNFVVSGAFTIEEAVAKPGLKSCQ
ncbi:hypothetical protein [Alkalimarinus coralli]|uniref:hypothetical protein n=1 Tax=Alkalimarinus coralli TaxID=2935863 RepID=UPI00202B2A4F|nr:hypothetical protein [Alkalimarinus coralli]